VDSVLAGFESVVGSLFGVRMEEEGFGEGEAWCDVRGGGVKKFGFYDEGSGAPLGTLYFDLFPRENKYTHAAHFTVRCGCSFFDDREGGVVDQTPIVAVVVNLGSKSESNPLNFSECETLAHEFGHALHSLLSRTRFQHLSGTRGPTDFVEIPSHLFEYLIADEATLPLFTQGNEALSPGLVGMLKRSKEEFGGIDSMTQAMYAEFDQRLFGEHTGAVDSTAILKSVHEDYDMPYAEGTHWHSTFGHVNTYGGAYYSYLWAQCVAKDIYEGLRGGEGGTVGRGSGQRIRALLGPGSSEDPYVTIRNALGGKDWGGYGGRS
jgi:intermediate peptidase